MYVSTITAILFVLELIVILDNPYKCMLSEDQLKNQPLTSWRKLEAENKTQQP